jgi:hypothetical protein
MEVFRFHPSLAGRFEDRLLVAEALEKARLRGEAINEYGTMLKMQSLTVKQRDLVQARMEDLKR